MLKHYTERLMKALDSGPHWPAEARMYLMAAAAYFIQQNIMKVMSYGDPRLPNMQTILEIAGMPAEDFEAYAAADTRQWVTGVFLPWLAAEEENAVKIDARQFSH